MLSKNKEPKWGPNCADIVPVRGVQARESLYWNIISTMGTPFGLRRGPTPTVFRVWPGQCTPNVSQACHAVRVPPTLAFTTTTLPRVPILSVLRERDSAF